MFIRNLRKEGMRMSAFEILSIVLMVLNIVITLLGIIITLLLEIIKNTKK